MERFEIVNRVSASPRELFGSLDANTCPDILALQGGAIAVIGEMCETQEDVPRILVPLEVGVSALATMLRQR